MSLPPEVGSSSSLLQKEPGSTPQPPPEPLRNRLMTRKKRTIERILKVSPDIEMLLIRISRLSQPSSGHKRDKTGLTKECYDTRNRRHFQRIWRMAFMIYLYRIHPMQTCRTQSFYQQHRAKQYYSLSTSILLIYLTIYCTLKTLN